MPKSIYVKKQQLGWKLLELLERWIHFFDDDPVSLVPAGIRITSVVTTAAIANVESDSYFPCRHSTTVSFYVGRPVDVQVAALVKGSVNSSWGLTLCVVKSEVPPLAAIRAGCDAKLVLVNNTEVGIISQLHKIAFLKTYKND